MDLISGRWAVYSETLPRSGSMRNGELYELPTLEHHTSGRESSSSPDDALLRTLCAAEAEGGPLHPDVARQRGQTLRLTGQVLAMTGGLLPTPEAADASGGRVSKDLGGKRPSGAKRSVTLATAVHHRLLPTPQANIADNAGSQDPAKRRAGGHSVSIQDVAEHELTPTASTEGSNHVDSPEGGPGEVVCRVWGAADPQEVCERTPRGQGRVSAEDALLATVREHEVHRDEERAPLPGAEAPGGDVRGMRDDQCFACAPQGPQPIERCSGEPGDPMRIVPPQAPLAGGPRKATRGDTKWGRFAPAIRRWESVLGRDAPAPTVPSTRDGRGRLNPRFCEWMMGLPDGWVTECGLSRSAELRILGNGVVPRQATTALTEMRAVLENRVARAA